MHRAGALGMGRKPKKQYSYYSTKRGCLNCPPLHITPYFQVQGSRSGETTAVLAGKAVTSQPLRYRNKKGADNMGNIINQIAEYTRLCREFSELPRNADSPEAYKPIERQRQALRGRIDALREEMKGVLS